MDIVEGPFGLRFIKVNSSQIYLGINKGAWVYASERPRHRVNLPAFMILESPISISQYASIIGEEDDSAGLKDMVTHDDVEKICTILSEYFDDEVRRPSQAEWKAAEAMIKLPCGWTELLADEAIGNHRGRKAEIRRNDWPNGGPQSVTISTPLARGRVRASGHPRRQTATKSWFQASGFAQEAGRGA